MNAYCRRSLPTPRRFVVGLVVFGAACHRHQPVAIAPAPTPAAKTEPSAPPSTPATTAVTSAASLARAIHDRHTATTYHTITFVQKTVVSLSSGSQIVQTWYTAGELPGHWRVETDVTSKGGTLYIGDSTYQFTSGKLVR